MHIGKYELFSWRRQTLGEHVSVTKQGSMIAYNNDFKLMMMLCLAAIPRVFLMRKGALA
jgi:hypothetical protein